MIYLNKIQGFKNTFVLTTKGFKQTNLLIEDGRIKLSDNIKNIIEKMRQVPENFESMANNITNKKRIEDLFNKSIEVIKDYFEELKDKFYEENNINECNH